MRYLPFLIALCLPAVLAACGGGGGGGESGAGYVPLPGYGMGDSYAFDDGSVRTVDGVSGDQVQWRGRHGETLVTTRDVLLPPLAETTPAMTVRRRLSTPGLFPLVPGKRVAFAATAEWQRPGEAPVVTHEAETCMVGGNVPLTTPAGAFQTVRVDCAVQRAPGQPSLSRTYYYAPAIGYFVRRDDRIGGGATHTAELRSYAVGNPPLPDSALVARSRAIQSALERNVSGSAVAWRDPASGAAGRAEPVLTERSPTRGWCREFREQMNVAARQYDLLGTACRGSGGTWQVQQVTPYRTATR